MSSLENYLGLPFIYTLHPFTLIQKCLELELADLAGDMGYNLSSAWATTEAAIHPLLNRDAS